MNLTKEDKRLRKSKRRLLSSINFSDSIADCFICYRNIADNELVNCPLCFNFFHRIHLMEWLAKRSICPICRKKINKNTIKERRRE